MDNIPSIIKIEYIHQSKLKVFTYSYGQQIPISDITDSDFTILDLNGTASLNEEQKETEAGYHFESKCQFFIAGNDLSVAALLTVFRTQFYAFRLTDVDGNQWLLGTRVNTPVFTYNRQNNRNPDGSKGFDCSIEWKSLEGAVYLS